MTLAPGLQVTDLSYAYGAKTALKGISFDVPQGRFCALLGPNGAGKSTLFSLLTRILIAPSGQIRLGGVDLAKNPRAALAQLGIVFQQPTLDLDLTVRQNLRYFAALHGISQRAADSRIDRSLAQLDMEMRADEQVRTLNGGHRRRTELARALLHDPTVLLLDEPTVGLDAASRVSITDHVHELAARGLTVLWATHLTDEIRDDDQLLILHQGTLLANDSAQAIRGDRSLSDYFLSITGEAA